MRLITHNWLICNKKGVQNGYPLIIEAEKVEVVESPFNVEFIKKVLPKMEWKVLVEAAKAVATDVEALPEELKEEYYDDEDFLKRVHHLLLDVHVEEGNLVCPESGRKFPIKNGIPNMLLNEDEV